MSGKHLVNQSLQQMAKQALAGSLTQFAQTPEKRAFVPAGGGAPGGDPMAGGGAPPMDPSMGGAPPMDPAMAGGGGGDPLAGLQPMIQQAVQAAMAGQGGGAGGAGGAEGGIKPKIDVNVELMQIKNMLAKMIDAMGIQMPASEMVATSENLNQMAENPGADPTASAGGAAGGSAISPIQPMQGASPAMAGGEKTGAAYENGKPYTPSASDNLQATGSMASQLASLIRSQHYA